MAKKTTASKRVPSQNLLRVFAAAARHLSFKLAAEELCVSPPAVSHQIRTLENYLETKLFVRLNRSLELTKEGEEYFSTVQASLAQIEQATNKLFFKNTTDTLNINAIPLVANLMIMPHLRYLQEQIPKVEIHIESQMETISFDSEDVDLAVRFQKGNETHLDYEPLFPVHVTPICSPEFLSQVQPEQLKSLKGFTLIRLTEDLNSWPLWMRQWHVDAQDHHYITLNSYQSAIEGARNGLGMMMAYFPPTQMLTKPGVFVTPFANQFSPLGQVFLVYRTKDRQNPLIQKFSEWFKELIANEWSDNFFLPE